MRTSTRGKLQAIDKLYPKERLDLSKERWRRLWAGEKPLDRLPFQVGAAPGACYYQAGLTPEQTLDAQLDSFALHGVAEDDFVPALAPGCHQGAIPEMFGAKELVVDGDHTCERLLQDIGEARDLRPAAIGPGSIAQGWLDMQRYFMEETEGLMPVHVADMQGPFDVAGQLVGYDKLMLAAYESPDDYHALLSRTTEAFILLWEAQARPLGDLFVGTHLWSWSWVPPGNGATVSVDSLVMFSPDFYERNVQPYLEVLSGRFGGIVTHSCGDFSGVVPALRRSKGLRGVNSSQMSLRCLIDAGVTPNQVIILGRDRSEVDETAALMAAARQPVELTVQNCFPGEPAQGKWDGEQVREIKGRVSQVVSAMTRAAEAFA